MNYTSFMKEISRRINQADPESLRAFVHEIARIQPEPGRARFLDVLSHFCDHQNGTNEENNGTEQNDSENETLAARVRETMEIIQSIIDGEMELDSEYNEEWDDWRDDDEEEFNFSDPDELLDDLEDAFKLLHTCYDQELFPEGAQLASLLSAVKVHVTGDYDGGWEDASMDITELVSNDLLHIQLRETAVEAAYLAYMGYPENKRADAILAILHNMNSEHVNLESILRAGNHEIDLQTFLPQWIDVLGRQNGSYDEELLLEAVAMLPDDEIKIRFAKKYAASHPALYHQILRSGQETGKDSGELLPVAMEAINLVPVSNSIRSDIALLAADCAIAENEAATAEECWLEAFRSRMSVTNYLRLRMRSEHWEDYSEEVRKIYQSKLTQWKGYDAEPSPAIPFFDGQFEQVRDRFMKVNKGIGWSSTFMKEGLALFLLLMNAGDKETSGIKEMRQKAFNACRFTSEAYYSGTGVHPEANNPEEFWKIFKSWKSMIVLSDELRDDLIRKMDHWIKIRVAAIMEANRRNYYGECAAYIAAYGEVLESMGKKNAKASLMERFRAEYSRRRAFIDELRHYGMRK